MFVVSGSVHKVNCPEMLKRLGLRKTFLTDEQKQLETLKRLHDRMDTTECPHSGCLISLPVGSAIKQQ